MEVVFYCENTQKHEVGTGHYWRSKVIAKELNKRGNKTSFIEDDIIINGPDVIVIDHIHSKRDVIERARQSGMSVVLIDGHEDDVGLVDTSVSAVVNPKAQYTGVDYMAFSKCPEWVRYNPQKKNKAVFVGMGGFDAHNIVAKILPVLAELKLPAIVAKSNNHPDFRTEFVDVEIFDEENYYDAMNECIIGIVNGGLTLFQALHYGLPCVAIPQYKHQSRNIDAVAACCLKSDISGLREKVKWLMASEYRRESLSVFAQNKVDGQGVDRICDLIDRIH